jgi:hypothetical protein
MGPNIRSDLKVAWLKPSDWHVPGNKGTVVCKMVGQLMPPTRFLKEVSLFKPFVISPQSSLTKLSQQLDRYSKYVLLTNGRKLRHSLSDETWRIERQAVFVLQRHEKCSSVSIVTMQRGVQQQNRGSVPVGNGVVSLSLLSQSRVYVPPSVTSSDNLSSFLMS